jgi:hypothetical protein
VIKSLKSYLTIVYPLKVAPLSNVTGATLILLGSGTDCSRSGGLDWMTGGVGGAGGAGGAGGIGGAGVVGGVGGAGVVKVLTTDLEFMPAVSETTPLFEFVVEL